MNPNHIQCMFYLLNSIPTVCTIYQRICLPTVCMSLLISLPTARMSYFTSLSLHVWVAPLLVYIHIPIEYSRMLYSCTSTPLYTYVFLCYGFINFIYLLHWNVLSKFSSDILMDCSRYFYVFFKCFAFSAFYILS